MPQLYADIGPMLLQYKNASSLGRKAILCDVIAQVEQLSGKVENKDQAKAHLKQLSYAATLINYADVLSRMENQQYFDILFDFYNMELGDALKEWFEFGQIPGQMRLKHPVSEYTPEIWNQFREAQKNHLIKNKKEHIFNLDQLDVEHPPEDQLYPIQIQMGGKLKNEAVDRIYADAEGRIRFAKRFGLFLLPGGGMIEIDNAAKIDDLKRKMLEEHLEEEHANLYIKAADLYDKLENTEFNQALRSAFESKQAKALSSEVIVRLNSRVVAEQLNSQKLKTIVDNIDQEIASEKLIKENIEREIATQSEEITKTAAAQQSTVDLDARLRELKEALGGNQNRLKTLVELRAIVQVQTFELTPLFAEAFEYVKENTKYVDIQQYLDTRVLGGSQISHSFIMSGLPLENWFKDKFHNVDGEFGDDIAGSEINRMTLLQVIEQFKKVKFSHLLIALADYEVCLDNDTLVVDNIWSAEQFDTARKSVITEATKLLPKDQYNLISEARARLQAAISALPDRKKKYAMRKHVNEFVTHISEADEPQKVNEAYKLFAKRSEILASQHSNLLKTVLTLAAVTVAGVLSGTIGFGIGFALGLWTGPGAFFTALAVGGSAAVMVAAATSTVGLTTGVLTAHSLFSQKQVGDIRSVEKTASGDEVKIKQNVEGVTSLSCF